MNSDAPVNISNNSLGVFPEILNISDKLDYHGDDRSKEELNTNKKQSVSIFNNDQ